MKIKFSDSFWNSLKYLSSWQYKTKDFFRTIKNNILKPYRIKPRYLDNNWIDRDRILAHLMFETLSKFIEEECSPGNIEWYGDMLNTVITPDIEIPGKLIEVNVRDEMQYLYNWWHKIYIPYEKVDNSIDGTEILGWDDFFIALNQPPEERSEKAKIYFEHLDSLYKFDKKMESELNTMLHRIVNISPYMWT